ncbi:branched-chain amino acid ABC transporter substrate-binding protein [Candidatus Poriferisodalis sp.]|uniref:branched-chain amino acid ABC transporter substrate-binding protein n=1 Tax=Candidatus Poriferisodalis sp. TaxID=3101277 RepID=UPI003B014C9D
MKRAAAIARPLGLVAAVVLAGACSNGTDAAADEDRSAGPLGEVRVAGDEAVQIRSISALGGSPDTESPVYLAVRMAVDDYGPLHGQFDVEVGAGLDGECSDAGGRRAARTVLRTESVIGVIGTQCSVAAIAAAPLLTEAGLVMISPSNTAPGLTSDLAGNAGEHRQVGYYRTAHNDLHVGRAVADFLFLELGLRRAAAIHDGDPYTEGLATAFADAFSERGGTVTASASIHRQAASHAATWDSVVESEPEAVLITLFPDEASEVLQHRPTDALGTISATVITSDFFGNEYLSEQRSAGLYLAGRDARHGDDVNESTGQGVADVRSRLAADIGEVSAGSYWPQAYDATTLLLDAIERASHLDDGVLVIERAALRDHLSATDGYDALTGMLACDAFGDCGAARIAVYQHLDPADPASAAGNVVFEYSR